ncbi:hypothetical protein ACTVJH_03690 [Desulfoplanes sp. PS50]|jgi:hypothetical protein
MKTSRTGKMSGNGLMNDAWLAQTVKPPQAGQAGHENKSALFCKGTFFLYAYNSLTGMEKGSGHSTGKGAKKPGL